jgi:cation diffusion facilitator CzcD-associated flavoprotein CzcO
MHTSAYKHPRQLAGRRVLIVGAGNSGCDIAVDAVHHAHAVDISVRRGYYFVPKYVFGRPADSVGGRITLPPWLKQRVDATILKWFTGDPVRFGFPKPEYRMYESHPVVNSLILHHLGHGDLRVRADVERFDGPTVHFKDGSRADYDLVIAATGYKLHFPFIKAEALNWQGMAPRLYLNIFPPHYRRLAVLGMVEASGLGWQGRYEQAELLAAYLKAQDEGRPAAAAFEAKVRGPLPDLSGGYRYLKLERMAYYVHKDTYRAAVRAAAKELAA